MANTIEIDVIAQDLASNVLELIKNKFVDIGGTIGNVGAISTVAAAAIVTGFYKATQQAQEYDQSVKNMMMSTGGSADETSRLIQVVDDAGVSYETLQTAMKFAVKNGIEPNTESLAKLSDEYMKLAPGVERGQFLLDKFGKSGLEMARVMALGGDEIRRMSNEMSGGLVLTEQNIAASEEYRKNLDELDDSWNGFIITLGNKGIPILNQIFQGIENTSYAQEDYNEKLKEVIELYGDHGDRANNMRVLLMQEQEERYRAKDAINAHADALDDFQTSADGVYMSEKELEQAAKDEAKAQQEAAKEMSNRNKTMLTTISSMQSNMDRYSKEYERINNDIKLSDTDRASALQDLAQEQQDATKKIIFSMIEQQLAANGLDANETKALLHLGQSWGIYSAQAVSEGKKAVDMAASITKAINTIPSERTFTMKVLVEGSSNLGGLGAGFGVGSWYGSVYNSGKATGGPVDGGTPYLVGEQGPELFVPNQSGTIIPNDKLGGNASIQNMPLVINLSYAPTFSSANRDEFVNNITPVLDEWYRRRLVS